MIASRTTFSRREFSFTLENDIYMRFQSFSSCAEMKEKMIKLNPIKIDIGAVYSARVRRNLLSMLDCHLVLAFGKEKLARRNFSPS